MTDADRVVDDIYASLPTVACQRKCGRQVCGPIVAFPTEQRRMEQVGFPIRLTSLHEGPDGLRCSFYDHEHDGCRVHSVRPLLCRIYGAVLNPKMICPWGCAPSFWLTDEDVAGMLKRLTAVDGDPSASHERLMQILAT